MWGHWFIPFYGCCNDNQWQSSFQVTSLVYESKVTYWPEQRKKKRKKNCDMRRSVQNSCSIEFSQLRMWYCNYILKTLVRAGHQCRLWCSGLVRTTSSIPDWCVIIASLCVPANKSHASRSVFVTLPTAWKCVICIVSMSYLYCMLASMSVFKCFKSG